MNKDYFLKRAFEVHGDKYSYEKVPDYMENNKSKILVTCKKHGDFEISVRNFLSGRNCPLCNKENRINRHINTYSKKFIEKAKQIHGDKYDYSKVNYITQKDKVCIICQKHGEFWQTPSAHLKGEGCPLCSQRSFKYTTNEFIERAKEIHGDKYDYSKVNYIDKKTKVCIICPKHGEFWQTPSAHLKGCGCQKCGNEKRKNGRKKSKEQFIKELEEKFGKIYKYDLIKWVDCHTKIKLIYKNKIIEQTPTIFLNSKKPITYERIRNTNDFIDKAKLIHGNRYDYSKTKYISQNENVTITCREHGDFIMKPSNHLDGCGCKFCKMSNLEKRLMQYLKDNDIKYESQKRPGFLSEGLSHQSLDFYLPEYKIAIECQGRQHFSNVFFKNLDMTIERDIRKNRKCLEHDIKIIYFIDRHVKKRHILNESMFDGIYSNENIFMDSKNGLLNLITYIKKSK